MRNTDFYGTPASFPSGERWYVVRTNMREEFRAQMGIEASGFRTFLPFITRWKHHARSRTVGKEALFPRYLFVEADFNKQPITSIHSARGVESIINNNGIPASIYGDFIFELLEKQLRGDFDRVRDKKLPLGAKVCVTEGRYEDQLGQIERYSGRRRAEVLISIMGRRVRETLSLAHLRPAW